MMGPSESTFQPHPLVYMTMCRPLPSALAALLMVLSLVACQESADPTPQPQPQLEPSHGTMTGYYPVRVHVADSMAPADVQWVQFGNNKAYDLKPGTDGFLEVTVQGHPKPGDVAVTFGNDDEVFTLESSFTYDLPILEGFTSLYALGASLTQGTQRGVPTKWSITHGPARMLAGQLGVYFPLPVLIQEGFQEMSPDLIGPPPYCEPPTLNDFQIEQASGVVEALTDPDTGEFFFADLRIDADLATQNFAVGGSRMSEILDGPKVGDVAMHFISHMAYDPTGTLFDPVKFSQMELIEEASPELIVSFDLLGNDLIDGMINDKDFSLEDITPIEIFLENIGKAVDRLAATGAQVFVATLPSPTHLPFFHAKRARLASEGLTENAPIVFTAIEEGVVAGNARLLEQADLYANVHVVDLAGHVNEWAITGVDLGNATLEIRQYGGLVGLDGLHFTDTAYALIANMFIDRMEEVLKTEIPRIDLAAIWAQDRERPEALKAKGLDTSQCEDFSQEK
jgi:lysophospholipase L1-like esterase